MFTPFFDEFPELVHSEFRNVTILDNVLRSDLKVKKHVINAGIFASSTGITTFNV